VLLATPVEESVSILPGWINGALERIEELSHRPEGWDSYQGSALETETAGILVDILLRLSPVIQSGPAISLRNDGGLIAEWANSRSSLELAIAPDGGVEVYHHNAETDQEQDISLADCPMLEKWLWQTSSTI
jgi:hypothetical protein